MGCLSEVVTLHVLQTIGVMASSVFIEWRQENPDVFSFGDELPPLTPGFHYTDGWFPDSHFQWCSRNSHHSRMFFPSRNVFAVLSHGSSRVERSILVSID